MKRAAGIVHKIMCSKLSKFALRALNIVYHKEIFGIVYQYVKHLSKNTLQTESKQFLCIEGK